MIGGLAGGFVYWAVAGRVVRRDGRASKGMNRVLTYLGRFFIILVGYAVAALAASAFLNIVFLASADSRPSRRLKWSTGSFIFSIPFVALFVAYFAFIPSVAAILLGEILGKRDWLFYAIAGGIIAVVVSASSARRQRYVRRFRRARPAAKPKKRARRSPIRASPAGDRRRHVRRHSLLGGRRPSRWQLARRGAKDAISPAP